MGRKKKSLIEKSPFKLRHRKLADGRLSLFLDRSVDGGHEYEFLQLYLMPETSAKARRQNAQTLRKAEDIQRVADGIGVSRRRGMRPPPHGSFGTVETPVRALAAKR